MNFNYLQQQTIFHSIQTQHKTLFEVMEFISQWQTLQRN